MKDCQYNYRLIVCDEKNLIRESTSEGSAKGLVNKRVLQRVVDDAVEYGVYAEEEIRAETGHACLQS